MKMNSAKVGTVLTLIGGLLWGVSGVCAQYLFQYTDITTRWIIPIRLTGAGGIMLVYFLFKDGVKKTTEVWRTPKNARDIIIYGLFGLMLCQYCYFRAIEWSNAGTATVIQYLGPALVVVWVCVTTKRLPQINEVLAVVLALLGVFLIATHGDPGSLVLSQKALGMALLSAVALMIYTVEPASLQKQFSTPLILAWGMVIGGCFMTVVERPWRYSVALTPLVVFGTIFVIFFGTILGFSCYMLGVKSIGSVKASLLACVEPIASMILTVVFMDVKFTLMDLFGTALIIITIIILAIPPKQKSPV